MLLLTKVGDTPKDRESWTCIEIQGWKWKTNNEDKRTKSRWKSPRKPACFLIISGASMLIDSFYFYMRILFILNKKISINKLSSYSNSHNVSSFVFDLIAFDLFYCKLRIFYKPVTFPLLFIRVTLVWTRPSTIVFSLVQIFGDHQICSEAY